MQTVKARLVLYPVVLIPTASTIASMVLRAATLPTLRLYSLGASSAKLYMQKHAHEHHDAWRFYRMKCERGRQFLLPTCVLV